MADNFNFRKPDAKVDPSAPATAGTPTTEGPSVLNSTLVRASPAVFHHTSMPGPNSKVDASTAANIYSSVPFRAPAPGRNFTFVSPDKTQTKDPARSNQVDLHSSAGTHDRNMEVVGGLTSCETTKFPIKVSAATAASATQRTPHNLVGPTVQYKAGMHMLHGTHGRQAGVYADTNTGHVVHVDTPAIHAATSHEQMEAYRAAREKQEVEKMMLDTSAELEDLRLLEKPVSTNVGGNDAMHLD